RHGASFYVLCAVEEISPAHPAKRDAVIEKNRPRILLADLFALQTRAREHKQLRIDWDLERLNRRSQITGAALECEAQRTRLELTVDVLDDVVDRRGGVVDGRIVSRAAECSGAPRIGPRCNAGKGEQH